jgi:hypothetical protein
MSERIIGHRKAGLRNAAWLLLVTASAALAQTAPAPTAAAVQASPRAAIQWSRPAADTLRPGENVMINPQPLPPKQQRETLQ